ncbi:looped-hinge helix DNA binding domain-containing protein, AbrB family [Lampropedia hyalina DSM 16112]|uniref:Looped-hinge helix DNA binding domain-containing protein, AbrB family n=1 Tax=Lampropedia hyalina DSM 16112 TaxID=1122156 RepID=A0A1M4YR69_9BURK|nr:AbrB/MazE/SpoVT family DNA-binding domain-containing protein [Lampropedia hyalina]SHF08178.1 looped-hinge helix DNA binding domain-containing protein, AbrB family [Lampropedia hyalina DSM 16112]
MPIRPEVTRLSSKGQIVLPGAIRHARQWEAGTEFLVQETPEGVLLKPIAKPGQGTARIEDVAGCLKPRRAQVSLDEMNAAIATEAAKRHARGRY